MDIVGGGEYACWSIELNQLYLQLNRPPMSDRIVMRTGESLVAGGPPFTAAEPEVVIGELDGPVGTAIATLTGSQAAGHSKVFAILDTDIQVRPVTLMVSKVTVKSSAYTNILMGTVQAAIANGVLDAVRAGDIPREKAIFSIESIPYQRGRAKIVLIGSVGSNIANICHGDYFCISRFNIGRFVKVNIYTRSCFTN